MKEIKGGVCAALGFKASAIAAEIKYRGRDDMAMVYSESPCVAAGTFTTNVVKAAPVKWDMKVVHERGSARAVVVNTGIANACTGEEGMQVVRSTAEAAAVALGVESGEVLIGSTGVIGMQLPEEKLTAGAGSLAKALERSPEAANRAARAIMTTDTHEKEIAYELEIGGKTVRVGGMSKGSGMIQPNMATMLCVLTTDVPLEAQTDRKSVV